MRDRRTLWACLLALALALQSFEGGVKAAPDEAQPGGKGRSSPVMPQQGPVQLSPIQRQLIGVTYGTVTKKPLVKVIRTVGRVEYDERKLAEVTLKISGWIQDLVVNSTGRLVKKGQPLLTIYSPDLVSAQQEYLLALRTRDKLKDSRLHEALESAEFLVEASRNRLLLWDLTPAQIRALEQSGKPQFHQILYSPITGYVIEKEALQGQRVEPGTTLYKIADLSTVWVKAAIYEYELPLIREGQEAAISLAYIPGAVWRGTVDYIYPYLETETRTNQVRFVFPNPDHKLKPGMYANMELKADLGEKRVVPESAVLHSGVRNLVFVDRGEGRLEPREVTLGMQTEGYWEVLDGLEEGERIASSGNFLIDSESKLAAAESMMAMMGQIGMGDWKMESAKPMEMGGGTPAAGPQEKAIGDLRLRISTQPEPAKVGENALRIEVKDARGQPVTHAALAVEYTMDMPGMPIDKAEVRHIGDGVYETQVRFTMAGPWGVTVSLRQPGQAEVRERFTINASLEEAEAKKSMEMGSARPMEEEMGAAVPQKEKPAGEIKLRLGTQPEPAQVGDNTLRIEVRDAGDRPVTGATVAVEYTMDMPGMMVDKAEAVPIGKGVYEAKVRFTMAGPWSVTVKVERPGQAKVHERFTVNAHLQGGGS
ncbi:efflux RND transporter periplasmic adaptor subunit [Methylocaldum sp. BRCS4]|uniref:efflux RND transporter periplasmic adaptor subunit n=1 Tax=Methylocaldum sp. 14B TaxID=1912213 RepID=UPI00098B395A|nr:efflux RND transporter periplasmic adaptor subunit [Methylocaldum sp. 14B]MVF23103.1 efflux RND transporter periplasmic adaptor subunit [Methylocaldum sp. BRCS4]